MMRVFVNYDIMEIVETSLYAENYGMWSISVSDAMYYAVEADKC